MSSELEDKYRPLITEPLKLHSIQHVNCKPHPFVVGPRHVAYAAQHCGGMLEQDVLDMIPCAHPGCGLSYSEHTSDHVMFVQFTRNCTRAEVQTVLKVAAETMPADKIDGFAFVDTPEKFRVS